MSSSTRFSAARSPIPITATGKSTPSCAADDLPTSIRRRAPSSSKRRWTRIWPTSSAKLNKTYVLYGGVAKEKQANQAAQDVNALKNAPAAASARALSKANGVYRCVDWDLVDRCKYDPKFDVKKLKDEELSEEMRKMKPQEREEYVKKKAAEREAIQKDITALSEKRMVYIQEQQKKNPSQTDKAFDDAVRGACATKPRRRELRYPNSPLSRSRSRSRFAAGNGNGNGNGRIREDNR